MKDFFSEDELKCKCGCGLDSRYSLRVLLNNARVLSGTSYTISSGARCKNHNKKVGGSETSSHLKGLAVDIFVKNNFEKAKILSGLFRAGFNRIGVADNFIHCDIDNSKKESFWIY